MHWQFYMDTIHTTYSEYCDCGFWLGIPPWAKILDYFGDWHYRARELSCWECWSVKPEVSGSSPSSVQYALLINTGTYLTQIMLPTTHKLDILKIGSQFLIGNAQVLTITVTQDDIGALASQFQGHPLQIGTARCLLNNVTDLSINRARPFHLSGCSDQTLSQWSKVGTYKTHQRFTSIS